MARKCKRREEKSNIVVGKIIPTMIPVTKGVSISRFRNGNAIIDSRNYITSAHDITEARDPPPVDVSKYF